jgi:YceI-like domain
MAYAYGPDSGKLTVRTGKGGAASKAGHNLLLEVTKWQGTLDLDEQRLTLTADPSSLRVVDGSGGVMPLGDDEKASIPQTIDEEVLKGTPIEFQSTRLQVDGDRIESDGDLDLFGKRQPIRFGLRIDDDGHVEGSARIKHSDFGVKPYTALFGTLKVADEVEIAVDANARSSDG